MPRARLCGRGSPARAVRSKSFRAIQPLKHARQQIGKIVRYQSRSKGLCKLAVNPNRRRGRIECGHALRGKARDKPSERVAASRRCKPRRSILVHGGRDFQDVRRQ